MTIFVYDDMSGTPGAGLTTRSGPIGATWTQSSASARDMVLTNANRARGNGDTSVLYPSGTPSGADYSVEAPFYFATSADVSFTQILARMATDLSAFIRVRWGGSGWNLGDSVSGFVDSYADVPADGTSRLVKLDVSGTAVVVYIDGVSRMSMTTSVLTAAKPGIISVFGTNTTGQHLTSFTATEAGGPTGSFRYFYGQSPFYGAQ